MTDMLIKPGVACGLLRWTDVNGHQGERYLRENEQVTIGRGLGNDVPLESRRVSRRHLVVEWREGRFWAVDQNSTNGSRLNDHPLLEPAELIDGDKLFLGNVEITYYAVEAGSIPDAKVQESIEAALRPPSMDAGASSGSTSKLVPDDTAPPGKAIGEQTMMDDLTGMSMEALQQVAASRLTVDEGQVRMPRLLVTAGPDAGLDVRLNADSIVIGRATADLSYDISLRDRRVSRPHAQLERSDESYLLTDLESTNGTYLNGRRIVGSAMLADGDLITIGETMILFRLFR